MSWHNLGCYADPTDNNGPLFPCVLNVTVYVQDSDNEPFVPVCNRQIQCSIILMTLFPCFFIDHRCCSRQIQWATDLISPNVSLRQIQWSTVLIHCSDRMIYCVHVIHITRVHIPIVQSLRHIQWPIILDRLKYVTNQNAACERIHVNNGSLAHCSK